MSDSICCVHPLLDPSEAISFTQRALPWGTLARFTLTTQVSGLGTPGNAAPALGTPSCLLSVPRKCFSLPEVNLFLYTLSV